MKFGKRKIIRTAALLVLLTMMVLTGTSCRNVAAPVEWTYSNFQRREATYEDMSSLGVNGWVVYAPYVYSCSVERTDLLNGDNTPKSGECLFIPYVLFFRQDTTSQQTEEKWTAVLKVAEMTRIEGTGYYGEGPFECRNVEIAIGGGAYTHLLGPAETGTYLDGTGLSKYMQDNGRTMCGKLSGPVLNTDDTVAARLDQVWAEARRYQEGQSNQTPEVVTAVSLGMVDTSQRLKKDTNAEDGHSFGAYVQTQWNKKVLPAEEHFNPARCKGYYRVNFEVYNRETKETEQLSTGVQSFTYEMLPPKGADSPTEPDE